MKKIITRVIPVLLILCMVFAMAACGGQTAAPSGGDAAPSGGSAASSGGSSTAAPSGGDAAPAAGMTAADTVVPGSTFTFGWNQEIMTYVPWNGQNMVVLNAMYDNLLDKYRGDHNDLRCSLAESYTVSDDNLTYVFKIREDAKFASGNPVNAEAFVISWDEASKYQPRYFVNVESYEATGEYELTIKLKETSATFLFDLVMDHNCGPCDPEVLTQYGTEDNRAAIGAGPYYLEEYVPGEYCVLKANPYYNREGCLPTIETVTYKFILDANTMMLAFMSGELDMMQFTDTETYHTLTDAGFRVDTVERTANPYWFNCGRIEAFRDERVREAICHMINWDDVNKLAYDGLMPELNGFWRSTAFVPYGPEHDYNPELGLQLLAEAGYKPEDLDFEFVTSSSGGDAPYIIQEQLRQLGLVNVKVGVYDGGVSYSKLKSGEYDGIMASFNGYNLTVPFNAYSMGLVDGATQRIIWIDEADGGKYKEEALDLYYKGMYAPTWEEHVDYCKQLTKLLQDHCFGFNSLGAVYFYGISDRVEDFAYDDVTDYVRLEWVTLK